MRNGNRSAWLVIVAAGALALGAAGAARATPVEGGGPEHSGFYFNTDVGPANGYYHFTGPHDSLDTHAGAANLDFRFGYALTPGLVISGDLSGTATGNNPATTLDGFKVNSTSDYYFSSALIGVGLTWYFQDNLLFGFTVGTGRVTLNFDNTDLNSDNGFATQFRFGKEWWVGDHWGLGVVGGVSYVTANADTRIYAYNPYGHPLTAYFDHADATTGFLAFTATFN